MSGKGTELEVKFCISDLAGLQKKLQAAGATLRTARQYESNLRFDTPDGQLGHSLRALRLRQDDAARMTFKGPPLLEGGARLRQEYEFTVSDFEMARKLLEALGFQVVVMYEKYRATYALGAVLVTLDEMPYGHFAEIEGPDAESIQAAAQQLGLNWSKRCLDSYLMLFDHLKLQHGFAFRDLSFVNFANLEITLADLGVEAADR